MKKVLILSLLLSTVSVGVHAEGTAVSDTQVLSQLQRIELQLQQINQNFKRNGNENPFTCTDGDKSYSVGYILRTPQANYRCEENNGHGEWKTSQY